jgi:RNA polymerase sigma-70 factor, ECF subfamily
MFRARGCSAEEAADLAQDAAVRAFMHIRRWGVASSGLDPLLNRIARNLLIDRYRRTTPHLVPLDSADEIGDPAQDPTEEVARRQRRTAVHTAIRSLPVRHQKAITYSLSGLTPEEVGQQMGIGRNAADALLHRARRSLREHLAPVKDGMWGVALAFKVRWDKLTRRIGLDEHIADASIATAGTSAMSVATAAIVAVLTVTGGTGAGTPAFAGGGSLTPKSNRAAVVHTAVVKPSTAQVGTTSSSSGSTSTPYTLGPAHGTYTPDGTDNHVTVPSDDPDQPLVDVHTWLYEEPGDPGTQAPRPHPCQRLLPCGALGHA